MEKRALEDANCEGESDAKCARTEGSGEDKGSDAKCARTEESGDKSLDTSLNTEDGGRPHQELLPPPELEVALAAVRAVLDSNDIAIGTRLEVSWEKIFSGRAH